MNNILCDLLGVEELQPFFNREEKSMIKEIYRVNKDGYREHYNRHKMTWNTCSNEHQLVTLIMNPEFVKTVEKVELNESEKAFLLNMFYIFGHIKNFCKIKDKIKISTGKYTWHVADNGVLPFLEDKTSYSVKYIIEVNKEEKEIPVEVEVWKF